ncbi:MAG: tetratricopeptide repeat protein [Proteobacteria bacterium]|nr:tetratricopeptide repeat protein [Pseudomonadota bacterium]
MWGLALFAGILSNHLGAIAFLATVFLAEAVFWKWKFFSRLRRPQNRFLTLFVKNDQNSDSLLVHEIRECLRQNPSPRERESLNQLLSLVEFRHLLIYPPRSGKEALQEAFLLRGRGEERKERVQASEFSVDDFTIQEIADAATSISSAFWKVHQIAIDDKNILSRPARRLLEMILSKPFESSIYSRYTETLTDSIQREGGVPFLLLNLISRGQWEWAKPLGQRLLTSDLSIEEESRACLYWMSEIQWFTRCSVTVPDFESTIRHLYHLCFVNPERVGFLEIDSQFFSQFETVNELAREGFLFKETLVDRVLHLWSEQAFFFDSLFRETLQVLTQQKSKVYQTRESWVKLWGREKEDFEKEYLFLVEGNLHYVSKDFDQALEFFDKALEINPHSRPALLNRLFCLAKTNNAITHRKSVDEILSMKSLYPSSLSVIGNSFLLLGEDEEAKKIYAELSQVDGWARKTDYYQSTFCFENGLYDKALKFALKAHELNPEDMSVGFHLSQCYSAVGKKSDALEILKKLDGRGPQWLNYYRFTLERDAGRFGDAHQTLLQIPIEYFDDPDELEAALDFAKNSSDLNLLRRLKSRR